MPVRAASVLRVSTKRQLNDGDGIENQRRGNAEYARRKGYALVHEFVVAESADGDDRAAFEAAVRRALDPALRVEVIVFWKVDRISRGGVLPYYTLKAFLAKHGVRVEFATEAIDESASGELMETLLAGMARFENRQRVERTIGVARILTKAGYWCRGAPLGFRVARKEGKPVLAPRDPDQWALVRYGLRKQLEGTASAAAVCAELRAKGLVSNKGRPLARTTWENVCRSPVYGGLVREAWTGGEFVRAQFDGPLTPDEWHALQRVLDGRRPSVALTLPRPPARPDFPLRRFLRCPACGRFARGYHARGRHGGRFAYYDCKTRACGFRVKAADAHAAFAELLARVTPTPELLALFRAGVAAAWEEAVAAERAGNGVLDARRKELEAEKAQVLALMKRATDPDLLADLEGEYKRVKAGLSELATQTGASPLGDFDATTVIDHCTGVIGRAVEHWQAWPVDEQTRLQRLVFPAGVDHAELTGGRTPPVSLLYRLIADPHAAPVELAAQKGQSSNPVFETLIDWFRVLGGEKGGC
jgi:site-specific DNA recombinase